MFRHQSGQKSAVHAASDVVARGYGEKRAGVVVESDGIVKTCGFGSQLAEAHHAFRAVEEPPRRAEAETGVMPSQGRQFATIGGFIQGKEDKSQRGVVAEAVQQRLQSVNVIGPHGNVGADVTAEIFKYFAIV